MLDAAPHGYPVSVGGNHEAVWLDRKMSDHRERIRVLDHDVGCGRFHVTPAEAELREDVRARQRVVRPKLGVLDQSSVRIESFRDAVHAGEHVVLDPDETRRGLGGHLRLCSHRGDRLPVVVGLADGKDRPIVEHGPVPGHRLGEISRGDDRADAGHRFGGRGVDGSNAGSRGVERHEFHVKNICQPDVAHVLLAAGDAFRAAEAHGGAADAVAAHRSEASAADRIASVIWRYPAHRHRLPDMAS